MARQTAKIANSNLLTGQKLYQERARLVLPYLVRQAKAGQTIYYSDLAEEVKISNPRNLNYVLGAIGNALIDLGKSNGIDIPPIQCLVINKRDELPGEGIGWFISPADFSKLSRTRRQQVVNTQLTRIFTFHDWDSVLHQLGLQPLKIDLNEEIDKAIKFTNGGESEFHLRFKEYIFHNPSVLGLNGSIK
jgi:hypothetical protein